MKKRKHAHYFKDLTGIAELDVYRLLRLYKITDQAIGHAIKKLMVAGGRGAGKDVSVDIRESIETLERWEELEAEDKEVERIFANRSAGGSIATPAPMMQPPPPHPLQPSPASNPNE